MSKFLVALLGAALLATVPIAASAQSTSSHPIEQIQQAAQLFERGQREEAVYLYYVGQLRLRIYLMARPNLPPDGEPALAASLFEVVGRPINEWAAGDIDQLVATLDRVIDWHAANDDQLTPKARHRRAHRQNVAGLRDLRDHFDHNRALVRQQREANGLENR